MIKTVVIGNSHINGFSKAIDKISKNKDEIIYVPTLWMKNPWFDFKANNYYKNIELIKNNPLNLSSLIIPHDKPINIVIVGLNFLGDSITRLFGDLKFIDNDSNAQQYSPLIPYLNHASNNQININKNGLISEDLAKVLYNEYIGHLITTFKSLNNCKLFCNVYRVAAPDMTEQTAELRFGKEFVESSNYTSHKKIATLLLKRQLKQEKITKFFLFHNEKMLSESGFTENKYASSDSLGDIHTNASFFEPIVKQLARKGIV